MTAKPNRNIEHYLRWMMHKRGMDYFSFEDREDVLQELRLVAWKAEMHYDESKAASLETFINLCAMNRITNIWAKRKKDVNAINFSDLHPLRDTHAGGDDFESSAELKLEDIFSEKRFDVVEEAQAQIEADEVLADLSERDRSILLLYSSGLTFDEVGERLGVSRQAIHQRYQRLVKQLRAPS